ncbi:MAG TPA: chemotaxis response regulator protein-glutamate methylesterase [Candidatus Krumholzibacteria bacterium]|nr:chemotaxis response regulator protein-glutamate methylesterase [Candidatus Krumholzibacteria bacterium]
MTIRILIVDDSAFIRRALKRILGSDPDFEVTASAANGHLALRALEQHDIDAVVLDVEMPVMNGLETLEAIRARDRSLPVVMFSTLTTQGGEAALEALARGASDCVAKPSNQDSQEGAFQAVRDELLPRLRSLVETHSIRRRPTRSDPPPDGPTPSTPESRPSVAIPDTVPPPRGRERKSSVDLVAIGVSTGGPNALATVLGSLPADLGVPMVITQHMPPLFTKLLAQRLDGASSLRVTEASDDVVVEPGHVHLAPGDRHLTLVRSEGAIRVKLDDGPPVNSCRPAVDVMLDSIVETHRDRVLVVILTGMGRDGLEGCRKLGELGAHVVVQDAESSVVWGMPGHVAKEGLADSIVSIDSIASEITSVVRAGARASQNPVRAGVTP